MSTTEREVVVEGVKDRHPRRSWTDELPPIEEFLARVGGRVRHHRSLMHLTRRALADRSGVSERYLAQLETGRGNSSIVLLRRVACALELRLTDLVSEDEDVRV